MSFSLTLASQEKEVAKREKEASKESAAAAKQVNEVAKKNAELDKLDAQVCVCTMCCTTDLLVAQASFQSCLKKVLLISACDSHLSPHCSAALLCIADQGGAGCTSAAGG